jgi:hypothetical protein
LRWAYRDMSGLVVAPFQSSDRHLSCRVRIGHPFHYLRTRPRCGKLERPAAAPFAPSRIVGIVCCVVLGSRS